MRKLSSRLRREQKLNITGRERDVIRLLVGGLTNKQIGQHLGISHNTVRDHMSSVFGKLKVRNRVELVILAADFISN
ncbi:response regulator transcription factor [Pseudomonas syringae group genomosp. 3]|uniref:response regulator transcription factor n=1 Tax=Pseudomonas syringae group genomosp. 3 TaxID=251701 RepID=UPI000F00F0FD|nr:helix-turn-helix transcriptional regulator [Pseudomonas syringae group genomosp. 3]